MKLYYTFSLRIASVKFLVFWLIVCATGLLFIVIPWQEKIINGSESGLIDLMPFFSKADFYKALENYGEIGRAAYLENWFYDFFYPIVYMFLLYTFLGLAFKRIKLSAKKGIFWMYIPLFIVVIDFTENLSFLSIIQSYPEENNLLFWTAFTFSSLKWTSIFMLFSRISLTLFKKKVA